jgi:NAD(P)-dependent dehydrogenase (short-subunit alcohol dehydrogenase family)
MTSKYAASWISPKGPGDGRPTARQILEDEGRIGNLQGKVILITGCSSGLGIETARALKSTGAKLFLTVRNLEKGKEALSGILEPNSVELLHLDLESLDSVRSCVDDLKTRTDTLNILINNAGVRHTPKGQTKERFETQFGTNHVAHFLLFQLLKPLLLASSTPDFHSRVIAVASTAHRTSRLDFNDLNMSKRGYDPVVAYGQSKLANVYMAYEIERRYGAQGLHAWSVHPGGIRTGLQRFSWSDWFMVLRAGPVKTLNIMQNAEQGASTTVWAATSKELEGRGGKYLERCAVSVPVKKGWGPIDPGHALWAYDEGDAKRCWIETMKMVGLKDEDKI